jgi:uncharacterized protein (TIGR02058 family)
MPLKPAILEMGMGIDLHGGDYTKAAQRAVWNAVHQSSLMFLGMLGPDTSREMIVEVTLGIPKPEEVDEEAVLSMLPHGKGVLKAVVGGLEIEPREGSGDRTIMANAAIVVKVDVP